MREGKFTDEQKFEIALEMITGKVSQAEVCRKWGISSTYAYKLKGRALEILRSGMGRPAGQHMQSGPSGTVVAGRRLSTAPASNGRLYPTT